MNNSTVNFSASAGLVLLASLALAACSDSKEEGQTTAAVKASAPQPTFDHAHGKEVSDPIKHKFEHDFAERCVEREVKADSNQDQYRDRIAKSCMCIAQHLMKDLTAKEAELFLDRHKDTQSLRIRYEAAAYKCLQQNAQAKQHQTPAILQPQ
ncbi:MAG: hypothetical protein ACU837_12520 [Gammaproteobacteria bacterium]